MVLEKFTKTRRAILMKKYKVLIVSPKGDVLIDRDYDTFTFCGVPDESVDGIDDVGFTNPVFDMEVLLYTYKRLCDAGHKEQVDNFLATQLDDFIEECHRHTSTAIN